MTPSQPRSVIEQVLIERLIAYKSVIKVSTFIFP